MIVWSTTEVCRLTGLSYRQLDYWERADAVTPSIAESGGSGSRRGWSDLDVACLRAIAEVSRDVAAVGLGDMTTEFVKRLWTRLRDVPDIVICEGTLTISLARAMVHGG